MKEIKMTERTIMSFPKRMTSNLRRSLSTNSSSKKNDGDKRAHPRQQQSIMNNNENFIDNQQQHHQGPPTTPTTTSTTLETHQLKQQHHFRGEMNTYAALSAQAINKNLSDTDVERERMGDERKFIANGFIVDHMKQSPAQTRLRDRRRKRSNTIDAGALLKFRSTVSYQENLIREFYFYINMKSAYSTTLFNCKNCY